MIGRILAGRYKVDAVIGEGGMARVWRATDMNTGKAVAVKVLREEYWDDETFVRRFEREAQAASRMTHPNIVNLLDVGLEEDGTRYLVIEYVSGKTLKQLIQESGTIRPDMAAQIIIRVLAAVQHAHQNGVIHRDIKPQNILIDKEGAVKVSDFGIARVANSQTMSQDDEAVMGSVYYFSPEQAKGAVVDEKSDLYSVGVMFYEMLTGKVPFTGDTPVAIAMKHLQDKPTPPSEINPAVSPALDFVVLHAMEKRPRHRYASATDMLRDVRLAMEHPDTILAARAEAERRERELRLSQRKQQHVQRRVRWMRRVLVGVFSLLLLVITAIAGYTIMERILTNNRNRVEVPNVVGLQSVAAINMLVDNGLDPLIRYDWYDLVLEDIVADQSIAPGTFVERGEKITIAICRSNFNLSIPNVTNIPYGDAVTLLNNLGLVVGNVEQAVSQAEYNLVINQSIKPGTPANTGDSIDLVISGGSVTMPRLVDMTPEQATQTVMAFGLRLRSIDDEFVVVDKPEKVGVVVGQEPEAFREIKEGSSVSLKIGIPADTLYSASLTLDLLDIDPDTTVSVHLMDAAGNTTIEYSQTFEDSPGKITLDFYRVAAEEAWYYVYYNDEQQDSGSLMFTR